MNKDLLNQLLSHNTCTGKGTQDLAEYIKMYLSNYGFSSEILAFEEDSGLYSLVSFLNLGKDKSIIFSAHMDTVPVRKENWNTNPFELAEDNDNFYGRGSCDMKGQIAALLSNIEDYIKKSKYNIIIALSCDEESNLQSIIPITKYIQDNINLNNISHCIVMEPTNNKVGVSHKGIITGTIEVIGQEGHSSNPDNGVNAIIYGIEAVSELENAISKYINFEDLDNSSTLNIARFNGGRADNIIPGAAIITYSIRTTAQQHNKIVEDLNILGESFKNISPKCEINAEFTVQLLPFANKGDGIVSSIDLPKINLGYASEASAWSNLGIDTIVFGAGNIKDAHKDNEFIAKSSIKDFEKLILKFI